MNRGRRRVAVVALALAPVLGAPALAGAAPTTTTRPTSTTTTTTTTAPATSPVLAVDDPDSFFQTLFAAGGLAGAPYTVQWVTGTGGPADLSAVADGQADLTYTDGAGLAFAEAGHLPVVAVAGQQLAATPGHDVAALVVPAHSTVRSLADLKGRAVAVTPGTDSQAFGLLALHAAKVGHVSLVDLEPDAAVTALDQGAVDAAVLTQPYLAEAQAAGNVRVLTGQRQDTGLLVASRQALADPTVSASVVDFARRTASAEAALAASGSAAATFASRSGLSAATAARAASSVRVSGLRLTTAQVQAEQQLADALVAAGALHRRLHAAAGFDLPLNRVIAPPTRHR